MHAMNFNDSAQPRQPPWWLTLLLLTVTLIGGVFFVRFVTSYGEQLERQRILALANTAAASLNPEDVASLVAAGADAPSHAAFARVRTQLRRVHDVNPDFRFVYVMQRNARGEVVFVADAEAQSSDDYSTPGDIYDGPTDNIEHVLDHGAAEVEPPAHDHWGFWVTGLAAIRSTHDKKVIAVLGMDINANDWLAGRARYRNFALAISGLLLLLVGIFLLGMRMQHGSLLQIEVINTRLARELAERTRAQKELQLADAVVRNTEEGVMVLSQDMNIESVNPAFERITGYSLSEALGKAPPMLRDTTLQTKGLVDSIRNSLQSGGKWEGMLPAQRRDGTPYPQDTMVNAVRSEDGAIEHYAVVFRDATQQRALEDRLRMLSATDGLTGIANRRLFDETLEREWQRGMRGRSSLCLILADIDHFKRFNDSYGHVAGDEALKKVAVALRDCLHRGGDFLARYGGEEFAIILPVTDRDQALTIAERLRQCVFNLGIKHQSAGDTGCITISLGIARRVPDASQSPRDLIVAADGALYQAKHAGRNRVAVAD